MSARPSYRLGVNTCFAVKRWPQPARWAELVRERFGLDLVQHCFDLVDLDADAPLEEQAEAVRDACAANGLELHSTFTGLGAYSRNLLLDPEEHYRRRAVAWFRRAIAFTALAGGRMTGGHVGAYCIADWLDRRRRTQLHGELVGALRELAARSREHGLDAFLLENMAVRREPATMGAVEELLAEGDAEHAPIALCLDVGHQCVVGTSGEERDPYAWLVGLGARAPVVHLQQSDGESDHHWPFTAELNRVGRISAERVLAALDASGAHEVTLVLEVIPSFEADDDLVLAELVESVAHWRRALAHHAATGD